MRSSSIRARQNVQDDTFFDSQNAAYAQAIFEQYARNPDAVPKEWRQLFERGGDVAIPEGLLAPEQLTNSNAHTAVAKGLEEEPASAPSKARGTLSASAPAAQSLDENARALVDLLSLIHI